ncbi:MAG TPA: hypothetical protein VNG69_05085 [Casimicrobiaceae bacterium]|nr:hypothetical protein [Casimicrobiaceae bacterium]
MTNDRHDAPSATRDQFLMALDSNDRPRSLLLASYLTTCTHPLPSVTCIELDLPPGSAYAAAAKQVLERGA